MSLKPEMEERPLGQTGTLQEILDAGAEGFIQKPFLISTVAERLKEVFGGTIHD